MADLNDLTPLQREAVTLLAQGESPTAVRTQLELPQSTFALWREDHTFDAAVQAEKTRIATKTEKAGTPSTGALKRLAAATFGKVSRK